MSEMKITITGAAGYIGSSLCELLARKLDCEIYAFDNLYYNQGTLVSNVFCRNSNIHFFNEDITDWSDNLSGAIKGSDFIIPLAALVGAPLCNKYPEETVRVNYEWMETLVSKLLNETVIYPNTNSGYGTTASDQLCTEDTPTNPISLYAKTKDDAEKILLQRYEKSIAFRLATVFGCSYRPRTALLVNNLVKFALDHDHLTVFDGHFRRNYIHVRDICNAFLFAINNRDVMHGNVYNIGNDKINTTKLEMVEKICDRTGVSFSEDKSRTDPDKRDYVVSSQKLYDLGYEPIYTLSYGIDEMVKFYNIWNPLDEYKCKNY